MKMGRKTKEIIRDYSELSTIQGIVYIFQIDQSTCGRLFWILVVIAMFMLGGYWSISAFYQWQNNPVVTTVKTSAFPVSNIEFPAVTICGQGSNDVILSGGFLYMFFKFLKQNGVNLPVSPVRAAILMRRKFFLNDFTITPQEDAIIEQVVPYYKYSYGGMMEKFLYETYPGFQISDNLEALVPLFNSKNPDAIVLNMAFDEVFEICNFPTNICDSGFTWDPSSKLCFIVLNSTRNFWTAAEACLEKNAELIGFDNDKQIEGFLTLLNNGNITVSNNGSSDFFINAFGTPEDGFKFQGTAQFTYITNLTKLQVTNLGVDYNFCLKGSLFPNSTKLTLQSTPCDIESGTICRKPQNALSNCYQYLQSQLSVLFNPVLNNQLKNNANMKKAKYKSVFDRINKTSGFEGIFSLLWYSGLPCFDVNGITSTFEGEKSVLKSCFWKGIKVPCAAIFNTFPTDQGMCCAFNMKAADEIFKQIAYTKMVMGKQNIERKSSFMDYNTPDWYATSGEPTIQPGINKGLTVILDAHNDILSEGSVDSDSYGFTGVITSRGSYPLTNREGFQIIPGHSNQIGLSATKISADIDIMSINPKMRNCLFSEENALMKIHKKYSQSNCLLECALFYAQRILSQTKNMSKPCLPWYFPTYEKMGTICDPWEAAEFDIYFNNVPDSECSNCLPDCDTVIYEPSITTIPFRRCDFRNLGTSSMCNLDDALLPEPRIWARQVIKQLKLEGQVDILKRFRFASSERKYRYEMLAPGAFNPFADTYDAYEKDIAMVQIYFKTSSIIEFGTSVSQTWIDYFSAIGGLLGLCIGLSILTLIELLWWFLIILGNLLSPSKNRKKQ